MAVDFTKPDGFDPAKGYKRIKFGEDGGITESELAELQKIQDQRLRDTMEAFIGRVTALLSGTITFNGSTLTATSLVGFLDGELFQYSGNIALVNNDRVYVEILESEITYSQDPALLDSRMGEETTRRIKNTYSLKKTNTGAGKYFELGQIVSGVFVETAGRITPYADLGTDDINIVASKPASTLLISYPYGVSIFKYLTGDAGYPVTNSSIMTINNAQGTDGFQVLYGYVSNKPVQYVRYFTGSAWGTWEKFATTAEITAHANDAVAHITGTERTTWNSSQHKKLTESNGTGKSATNGDLNQTIEAGFYNVIASNVNGLSTSGNMLVMLRINGISQILHTTGNKLYSRFSNDTGVNWSPWIDYATTDVATSFVKGLMSPSDKNTLEGAQKTKLTPDSGGGFYHGEGKLDEILSTGFHYVGSSVLGKPPGSYFLVVSGASGADYVKQTLYQYEGDVIYTRTKKSGLQGFTEWKRQINNLELGRLITSGKFVDQSNANFVGKVAGSTSANPHFYKYGTISTLLNPSGGIEEGNAAKVDAIKKLDGLSASVSTVSNNAIAQGMFSFDVVFHVQSTYGNIPGATIADKIDWVRVNIPKLTLPWWGFGSSPSGSKVTIASYQGSSWVTGATHTQDTITKATVTLTGTALINAIDANGFVHFIVYADASDGATPSVVNTDYVELQVEISTGILDGLLNVTPTVRGIMSAQDKAKLDGVAMNANNYVHPSTHPATMIVQDFSNRFVTDAEKNTWNGKANNVVATQSLNGLMSATDKTKIDGIQGGAEVNQNAFSSFKVGGTTVQADGKTDTLELVPGTNISLVGDATNDTITVSVTGTVSSSASTPWGGITGKPTKVEDFGITDVALRYGANIQGGNWSRILSMTGATVYGHSFLLTVKGTRGGVAYKATLLVTTGHFRTGQITQLSNINYSDVTLRTVVDDNGNGFIEIYDNLNGIVVGTPQGIGIEIIKIQDSTLTPVTTYTSGATVPVNHVAQGQITTVKGKNFVGDLVGDVTGNATGNSGSATKLQTARSIALSGDATGSITFDGTGNVTIPVTVQDDSHNHTIANVDGLQTALDAKESVTGATTKANTAESNAKAQSVPRNDTRANTVDLNTYLATGFYAIGTTITNGPAGFAYGSLLVTTSATDRVTQVAFSPGNSKLYIRYATLAPLSWTAWIEMATTAVATGALNGLMSSTDKVVLDELNQDLTTIKSSKDSNGVFTVVLKRRKADNTLFSSSIISGGTSPQYTTRTVTYYQPNGTTVQRTVTLTLSYDSDGDLIQEV